MEPSSTPIFLTNVICLCVLVALYFFGVWLRSFVLPADSSIPASRQLMAAVPVGFITMGMYAKSALPPLLASKVDVSADIAVVIGYAIILGMMSRESLEKLLTLPKSG